MTAWQSEKIVSFKVVSGVNKNISYIFSTNRRLDVWKDGPKVTLDTFPRLESSSESSFSESSSCSCVSSLDTVKFYSVKLILDERLFWSVIHEMSKFRNYYYAVTNHLHHSYPSTPLKECMDCGMAPKVVHVKIRLIPWCGVLDKPWESHLDILLQQQLELEKAMAWLSTLGGAYSALGDHDKECAEEAGRIAFRQLKIASRIGDLLIVCRCHIYIAMSLLQRGYLRACKKIIRKQYDFATTPTGMLDRRLSKMCQSVWNRLKYERELRMLNKHLGGTTLS